MSCQLVLNEKTTQHFLVFKDTEFILVDPHKSKLGCGIVYFIAFLQVMDCTGYLRGIISFQEEYFMTF